MLGYWLGSGRTSAYWSTFLVVSLLLRASIVLCASQNNELVSDLLTKEYHNYESMKSLLEKLQTTFHKYSRLFSIGKSAKQRDLLVFQISDRVDELEPGEPSFKFVGNMVRISLL